MGPFMRVQKRLEGKKYVTDSLLLPQIYDLREGLNKALVDLREPAPANSRGKTAVVECGRPVC